MSSDSAFDPFGISSPTPSPVYKPGMKSWNDLRKTVQETQKVMSPLACSLPSSFTFKIVESNPGKKIRLYFLGIPPTRRETTLMYVDVPDEPEQTNPCLQWKPLLKSLSSSTPLSREEELLRERKRSGIYGISSYDYANEDGKFFFYACNNVHYCCDNDFIEESIAPCVIESSSPSAKIDLKICPQNSNLLAFVQDNDIWVTNIASGKEMRLTHAKKGSCNLTTDPLSAGVPSFVMQEEFDRYSGYWWQNEGNATESGTYRILYEEVDESDVDIINIYSSTSEEQNLDEYRYPRAGKQNARSTLKIMEFELLPDGTFSEERIIRELPEQDSLSSIFPWAEYIVRAGWVPNSSFVYAQLLDRKQTKLSLILIPLSCFVPITSDVEMDQHNGNNMPSVQVIYEDTSDVWINVHNILKFTDTSCSSEISFIWASEKTGHRHLYHITSKTMEQNHNQNGLHPDKALSPVVVKEKQLTDGDWEVLPQEIWVDKDKRLVYFIGLKNDPLESHLYVVSYVSPAEPELLTQLGYSHSISFSSDLSHFVSLYSSAQNCTLGDIYRLKDDEAKLYCEHVASLMESSDNAQWRVPELFNYQSKLGHKVYGMFYRPHEQVPNVKYPTVLFVYGGPQVQLVSNSFKGLKFLRVHPLAAQGYVVVIIDGRGSNNRGLQFESHLKHRLGTIEIEDQVEGLEYLASQLDFIDLNRVAIHGWSYGGYLSLMGLAQRPDIFKVAIAGAPVVNWNLYDTGYTERYMDMPQNNVDAYNESSVLNHIHCFPDDVNRLLIIHGLMDENVHFEHTSSLISALVKAGKPYQLQVYPNERHGIRNHDANEHYKTMILNFLQYNL